MPEPESSQVAIVDYGLGNLYSVKQACASVGLQATITSSKKEILESAAVILPGVGAFADAMANLHKLDLVTVLQDIARSPTLLIGICLGVQLLMTESYEFGRHAGLGILAGPVVRLDHPQEGERTLKVPQIGWNRIVPAGQGALSWEHTLLAGVPAGEYMYFVHSYIVQPQDSRVILSTTQYGNIRFCSSVQYNNIFACQFHPERSSKQGIKVYQNLALQLQRVHRGINL